MTTTNAELIATATAFKAAMSDANTDAPAPGSILDLWLRTADALEAATTITDLAKMLIPGIQHRDPDELRETEERWATALSNPEEAS